MVNKRALLTINANLKSHIHSFLPTIIPPVYLLLVCYLHFFQDVQHPWIRMRKTYKNQDLWQVSKMQLVWHVICDLCCRSDLLLNAQISINMKCVNTICKMCFQYAPLEHIKNSFCILYSHKCTFSTAWAKKLCKLTQIMYKLHKSWSSRGACWPSMQILNNIYILFYLQLFLSSPHTCMLHPFFPRCTMAVDLC